MPIEVVELLTEYAEEPLGLDTRRPRFSWKLASEERGQRQQAYRVLVSTDAEALRRDEGDMWDSGRVLSDQSVHVRYAGKPLKSGTRYYWKVRVWDRDGVSAGWSRQASWTMGLLDPDDWQAKWIGMDVPHSEEYRPVTYLRRTFRVRKPVARAVVHSSALGVYRLFIGGRRVGDHELAPGWTDYSKRIQYQTFEVTDFIGGGEQAIGAMLGTGWYCGKLAMVGKRTYGYCPYLIVQLHLEYEDGTKETIVTDETWRVSEGALRYSEIFRGEWCDARLERHGWLEPGYDDAGWSRPIELPYRGDRYGGKLVAQPDPPVRATREIRPASVTRTGDGVYLFNFGQNMVGRVRLKTSAPRGAAIAIDHAEALDADGKLYKANLRTAVQRDVYIAAGEGTEVYEPCFTYHGFRYVEVSGLSHEPDADTLTGVVIHTDGPEAGRFETSHPLVNRLHANIVWGQRGNFVSVPTDCPQRDERLGWTGDAQVFCRTATFNMESARFFAKYAADMCDAQLDSGSFSDVAPNCGYHQRKVAKRRGTEWTRPYSAGWADAGVIIPWTVYQVYGDTDILERCYPAMVSYMGYLAGIAREDRIPAELTHNYGDWLSMHADTPRELISNAYFAYSTGIMARIAAVLGHEEDAIRYREREKRIKAAFCQDFVLPDGRLRGGTQTAYALALAMGLLPEPAARLAARHLADEVKAGGCHPTSGFIGIRHLLPALSDYGYTDAAYELLLQETFPSWLHQIRSGATTMWERWDGYTEEGAINGSRMNSFNHYAFGAVGEWLYRYMAGIDTDPERPGFKHIRIAPRPGGGIAEVRAEHESMYGTIGSAWQMRDGKFRIEVRIPVNTTATIRLPFPALDGETTKEVGSGTYAFECVPVPAAIHE
ncbi:glycoside hydrolase family 78 protein [Paenibacillus cisolokensis]|uniref:family 78 glycoside hydrolase catalytic domain n=1 Tax=Paenibacillus cisolokensis TaxID=1658519 RepID=UPI003D2858ED